MPAQGRIPFVCIKIRQHMEAAALLAEALLDAVLDQRTKLEVVFTDPVALIVLLLL